MNQEVDIQLLSQIQPAGGIHFRDEEIVTTGTGYEACLHVYQFPSMISDAWMEKITSLEESIVSFDIGTKDTLTVKKNINKSLSEQKQRYVYAKNHEDQYEAKRRYDELEHLFHEIDAFGEVIKLVDIRIFISAKTKAELEDKRKFVIHRLESDSFKVAIFLNENKWEYLSIDTSYKGQDSYLFRVPPQALTSFNLVAGNPYNFSELSDEGGFFLGTTTTGGNVIFNEFLKTKARLHYNQMIVGTMGSGKSTLLKKMMLFRSIGGDMVRVFDVSGEFIPLTKALGGKVIKMDASEGMVNPLEILQSEEDENTSFSIHIAKLSTMYSLLGSSVEDEEKTIFENHLRDFYASLNLVPVYFEEGIRKERVVTGKNSREYPIYSDLKAYIEGKIKELENKKYHGLESEIAKKELLMLSKIRTNLTSLVGNYGYMFDGYTSIENILDEPVVCFDISGIKNLSANIFDAQMFNIVSLSWDNAVRNGKVMKDLYEGNKIKEWDISHFSMFVDEAHRWINANKVELLDLVTLFCREGRKYFSSMVFASQSLRDYAPSSNEKSDLDKLRLLFELTQYKFIFHQDPSVIGLAEELFRNELTPYQLNKISRLQQGEAILSIASDRSLEFKVYLAKDEERLFAGGK